jgi:hypothetical protein
MDDASLTLALLASRFPTVTQDGTLYVAGLAVDVQTDTSLLRGDTDGQRDFGYYDPRDAVIGLAPQTTPERRLRALIHEALHVTDEAYDLGLSHRHIRAIAATLSSVLMDPRNASLINPLLLRSS